MKLNNKSEITLITEDTYFIVKVLRMFVAFLHYTGVLHKNFLVSFILQVTINETFTYMV